MIPKTLALYAVSVAALGAVLTACGSPDAPEGPELAPQTATVAPEPRPEATHEDREGDRSDFMEPIVTMVWGAMTTGERAELCLSFAIMSHDEIVAYMNEGMTPDEREMINWDKGVTLIQAKCDGGDFTSAA